MMHICPPHRGYSSGNISSSMVTAGQSSDADGCTSGHKNRNSLNCFQWGECDLVCFCAVLVCSWLAVLLGIVVHEIASCISKTIHVERGSDVIPQQALQGGKVVRFDAPTGIDR